MADRQGVVHFQAAWDGGQGHMDHPDHPLKKISLFSGTTPPTPTRQSTYMPVGEPRRYGPGGPLRFGPSGTGPLGLVSANYMWSISILIPVHHDGA